jgi:hypothetical protein
MVMNKRLKELFEQAGTDVSGKWISVDNSQRLAELIVQDCADVMLEWKSEPFPFDPDFAVRLIKQHFGVEQ